MGMTMTRREADACARCGHVHDGVCAASGVLGLTCGCLTFVRREVGRAAADAWWNRLTNTERIHAAFAHGMPLPRRRTPRATDANRWWRSLPDERAITIYMSESRG